MLVDRKGVDFIVDPTPLTTEDRKRISEIIAHYKATGKKLSFQKPKIKSHRQKKHIPLTKSTNLQINTPTPSAYCHSAARLQRAWC